MDRLWRVGLFVKNDGYYDDVFDFANKLIKEKGEEIEEIRKCNNKFEIRTNKSIYKFVVVNENIRGYRWHEAYVFDTWLIDLEKIHSFILAKIMPYDVWDRDTEWNLNDCVHYNPII